MDISSNAQVGDATQTGERLPAADISSKEPVKNEEKPASAGGHHLRKLDDLSHPPPGYSEGKYRDRFYKIWRPRKAPKPPPSSLDDAPIIPLASCSWISELLYIWINPMMTLGYQRPLQGRLLGGVMTMRSDGVLCSYRPMEDGREANCSCASEEVSGRLR